MFERTPAIAAAAAQILGLINSRPQSPSQVEIEVIIADVVPPATPIIGPAASSRVAEIRLLGENISALYATGLDADIGAGDIDKTLTKLCESIWKTPPRTLIDLQERAEIARHWHRESADCRPMAGPWIEPSDCDDWGDRVIAELIVAVLTIGALPTAALG